MLDNTEARSLDSHIVCHKALTDHTVGLPTTQRPNDPTTQRPNDPTTQRPNDPTTQRPNDPN